MRIPQYRWTECHRRQWTAFHGKFRETRPRNPSNHNFSACFVVTMRLKSKKIEWIDSFMLENSLISNLHCISSKYPVYSYSRDSAIQQGFCSFTLWSAQSRDVSTEMATETTLRCSFFSLFSSLFERVPLSCLSLISIFSGCLLCFISCSCNYTSWIHVIEGVTKGVSQIEQIEGVDYFI